MRLGVVLRNMGPQSTRETLVAAARAADALPAIADLWVVDHIAIPPDDAEGSDGRYLDPLATLAYLAGVTTRVGLGTAVLVLPYRPALPTAKWIATVQELSGGRQGPARPGGRRPDAPPARRPRRRARPPRALRRGRRDARDPRRALRRRGRVPRHARSPGARGVSLLGQQLEPEEDLQPAEEERRGAEQGMDRPRPPIAPDAA